MGRDDLNAIITTLRLDHPLLLGWSLGGIIITEYVASYGEDQIAGTNWVAAVSRLGEPLRQDDFLSSLTCLSRRAQVNAYLRPPNGISNDCLIDMGWRFAGGCFSCGRGIVGLDRDAS